MKIVRSRADGATSAQRSDTFVGEVWSDPVVSGTEGVAVNSIFFAPGARTNWHYHEHGQLLQVTAGSGWVCTHGDAPQPLAAGDTVWAPAGELHWHGAGPSSFMTHTATSLGTTEWQEPVSDDDYEAGYRAGGGGSNE